MASIRRNGINYSSGGGIGGSGDTIVVGEGMVEELLWENPNPALTFASQTIQTGVDLSGYKYVRIYTRRSTSAPYVNPMTEIPINQTGLMYGSPSTKGGADAYRTATVNANGNIAFSTGITGSSESNNDMIPYQIYGVKESDATHILNPNEDSWELLYENANIANAVQVPVTIEKSVTNYDYIIVEACTETNGYYSTRSIPTKLLTDTKKRYNCQFIHDIGSMATIYSAVNISLDTSNTFIVDVAYAGFSAGIKVYGVKDNGGVTISKKDVYSTEEQEIGTWIDGKPLYRKAITGTATINSVNGADLIDAFFKPSLHNLIRVSLTIKNEANMTVLPTSFASISCNENGLYVATISAIGTVTYFGIVEYTKVSD